MHNPHKVKEYRGFIFDIDGVILLGGRVIPGSRETLLQLREEGKKLAFVSNNSTRAREDYFEKIKEKELPIEEEELVPATHATARYLAEKYSQKKIFVLGGLGLIKELLLAKLELTEKPVEAEVLVTGSDPNVNYSKLSGATNVLLKGSPWITCNTDKLYPLTEEKLIPGTGLVVGALAYITGREPDVIVGKPSTPIIEQALKVTGLKRGECLVVGDILDTDILAGKNAGVATALVLTGVTTRQGVESSSIKPDYILESIADLRG